MSEPRFLDDVERELFTRARISGDDGAEAYAALPVESVPATEAPPRPAPEVVPPISLNGEWRMAGHEPRRQFSIEHWTAAPGRKPTGAPPSWWREDTDRSGWIPATVPGTVQAALVAAGELPDPLWDANTYEELTAHGVPAEWPWHFRRTRVEEREWWLARSFTVPAPWRDRRVRLAFDGIDYAATVYVNGVPLRHHTGMFGGPEIDVTDLLRYGGENEVVVRIFPPPRDWHGVPKGSPGWGWHYGHLISMGIWRDVRLECVPDFELRDVFVRTEHLAADGSLAELRVRYDVVNHTGSAREIEITGRIGERAFGNTVAARRGPNRYETAITVEAPEVWWPMGYGEQPLHTLTLECPGSAVTTEFGIRTVETAGVPDWPGEEHYRWQFVVNGRRMFLKGANWCWTDPFLGGDFAKDAHILELARRANLQILRAWGGGMVEREEFYRACDRMGILVYQEFPLSFGLPEAPVTDLNVLDRTVSRVVRDLRNHPSLLLWGGGNENAETTGADEPHVLMGRRCLQLDPSRPFHRTSPWGGGAHNYRVYHEGEPIDSGYRAVDAVVYGEYGLSSQPNLESVPRFLPPEKLAAWPPPPDGGIMQHQSQFGLFDLVKQLRYASYGPVTSWAEMTEYSQVAQGEALRFASEMVRAGSGTHTSAFLFYKLTDLFPGASWSVVDFYGVPKLSYYQARRFCRARAAFAAYERLEWGADEPFRAVVHVANDTPHVLSGAEATATVYDARLRPVRERRERVTVPGDGRVAAFELEAGPEAHGGEVFLLAVALRDAGGALLSDQWYWFNARPKSERVRAIEARPMAELEAADPRELIAAYAEPGPAPLLTLPRTELAARMEPGALVVRNAGDVPAAHVVIDGFPHGYGAYLEDNGFFLRPGEERRVAVEAPGEPRLSVRAWNAPRTHT
ncbi:beta-mannosidase [Thermocatellispora tengchongensis]|uniref:Beta-mannosidase n=1 Tax=Thermocatellispora tengchongensis TaxID=1073253 RepID=A0A840P0M8_9ACTN|nr:sugar-binding domain-containing protein [Thermocatellispora tengchongensis]MBB5131451.1 beta-mannosidase [Thermocatellispora tengchongensis]